MRWQTEGVPLAEELAATLSLGSALAELTERFGGYELLAHWKQGEFHHDIVVRVDDEPAFFVIATNCNGGIKEVLSLAEVPERWALWHWRCPANAEFEGALPPLVDEARTTHWFDPCELLVADARSELRPEFRARQRGGGWIPKD